MSEYSKFIGVDNSPEMIAFCVEHCPHKTCKHGACEEYIAEYRRRHPRRTGGRTPMLYEAFGQKKTIVEWGRATGIDPKKLRGTMYYKKITLEEAIRIHAQIMGRPMLADFEEWLRDHPPTNAKPVSDDLTSGKAAELLNIDRHSISRMAKLEGFPARKAGRSNQQYIISRARLREWLYEHPAGIAWRQHREKIGRWKGWEE